MAALAIAQLTFREAFRRKVVWGVAILSLIFIALYAYGFHLAIDDVRGRSVPGAVSADLNVANWLVVLGLHTVNFLAGIMTIFAAVGTIASEIDAGRLHAIVPKPLARWEIVVGKYLGFAGMIAIYVSVMILAVVLTARVISNFTTPNVVKATLLLILVSLILLSLTILGSTIFSSIANGVIIFMLYGMAVTGGLLEQLGTFLNNEIMINIGIISGVLVPSDSMYRLASYVIQHPMTLSFAGPNPFSTNNPPSNMAIVYSVAYCLVLLFAATLIFRRRDL